MIKKLEKIGKLCLALGTMGEVKKFGRERVDAHNATPSNDQIGSAIAGLLSWDFEGPVIENSANNPFDIIVPEEKAFVELKSQKGNPLWILSNATIYPKTIRGYIPELNEQNQHLSQPVRDRVAAYASLDDYFDVYMLILYTDNKGNIVDYKVCRPEHTEEQYIQSKLFFPRLNEMSAQLIKDEFPLLDDDTLLTNVRKLFSFPNRKNPKWESNS